MSPTYVQSKIKANDFSKQRKKKAKKRKKDQNITMETKP